MWGTGISFIPLPLYSLGKNNWHQLNMRLGGFRCGVDVWRKKTSLSAWGDHLQNRSSSLQHSQSTAYENLYQRNVLSLQILKLGCIWCVAAWNRKEILGQFSP